MRPSDGFVGDVIRFPGNPDGGGGSGPDDPSLSVRVGWIERQVDRLDAKLDRIEERLRRVEESVAEIKGKLGQLPTTWQMFTAAIVGNVALAGTLIAALKFLGAH